MEVFDKQPHIYIIAGKARSGKDTIASIIKDYYQTIGKTTVVLAYSKYIKDYAKTISNWDGSDETKPRELLQILGTEIIRGKIDQAFFVNRIVEDIKIYSFFFDNIIIADARYPDEIDTPKQAFPTTKSIHVVRPNFISELTDTQNQHRSETGLDSYHNYDLEVINDGDLETLKLKIINLIKED